MVYFLAISLASSQSQPSGQSSPLTPYQAFVRQLRTNGSGVRPVCYLSAQTGSARALPPESFLRTQLSSTGGRAGATAQFIVDYRGFTTEARRAFQYAVDIWASLISSPVPIRIQANWTYLEPGALGSARPASYRIGSDGVQKALGYYPIALAEKIARRPLNDPNEPDIIADMSRNNNWYYGTDAKPLSDQPDLVTSALHEIAHGLGMIGFFDVVNGLGQYSAGLPSVYDHFIQNNPANATPVRAVSSSTLTNNSTALGNYLQSGNLYFSGPRAFQRFDIQRPRLASPKTFDRAESLYHLDEEFYNLKPENGLLRPRQKLGEAIHSPGQIVMTMLADLEWKTTSVLHEPLVSDETVRDLAFNVRVVSDTTLTINSVRLFYRKSPPTARDTAVTVVPLVRVGSSDEYRYTLPANQAQGQVWYYVSAQDASGRTFTNPGRSVSGQQFFYRVLSGPDNVPPVIRYNPAKNAVLNTVVADSLPIYATISDDRPAGISTASVEYQINGGATTTLPLRLSQATIDGVRYDSLYRTRIDFPAGSLKPGDRVTHRIVARDGSQNRNQAISPASGTYELRVITPQVPRDRYVNAFENVSAVATDFVTVGFSLTQPAEFGSPALHSQHPYGNGSDYHRQANAEALLRVPIRINANPDSATIRFDEVALIQPAEPGSRFGQAGFYDYVIVEGSNDNGRSWRPLADGYNARGQADWLSFYNQNLTEVLPGERNSTAVGQPALYQRRTIPLIGTFRAGETILIRFRLFSDATSYGWGWVIDNLRIQVPPPPVVLANEPVGVGQLSIYPNPVGTGLVRVEANLTKPVSQAELLVTTPVGQVLKRLSLRSVGTKLNETVELCSLPAGLYILRLDLGNAVLSRKIVVLP